MALYFLFAPLGKVPLGGAIEEEQPSIAFEVGSFALSMQTFGYKHNRALTFEAGALTLTFQSAALALKMPFERGAFTVAFPAAGLAGGRFLSWSPVPTPIYTYFLFAPLGSRPLGGVTQTEATTTFALELGAMFLRQGKTMSIDAGSVTLAFQGASTIYGRAIAPNAASYVLSFQSVALRITMPFAVGAVAVTFNPVEFTRGSVKIRRFPRVGSSSAKSRSMGAGMKARAYGG